MPLLKCTSSKAKPSKGIGYITRSDKAKFIDTRNLFEDEDYAKQFEQTAKRFGKGQDYKERKYYHVKLSCDIRDKVDAELHHDYALRMARELFPDEQCVIATHTDTKTIHSHIIVNAVNPITGKKLHFTDEEYAEMKDKANEIGREYGFSELDWRKSAKNRRTSDERHIRLKGGTSWKEELREVIEEGVRESKTPDEFKAYLEECYDVKITRDGKDYSYLHPQKKKPIRGAKLGANYTKTEVLKRLGEQKNGQKSGTHNGRIGGLDGESSGAGFERIGGHRQGIGAGRFIAEGIGAIEREMQQLNRAAEYAAKGSDAASEERRREQQRAREELERQQQERDEQARNSDRPASNSEDGNGSGNANSFGKGD